MKIYKILDIKNNNGKWLEEYEVPEGFPVESGWTTAAPSPLLRFPKWEYSSSTWVEDKDAVIASLTEDNKKLSADLKNATDKMDMTESALLDLADMILSR